MKAKKMLAWMLCFSSPLLLLDTRLCLFPLAGFIFLLTQTLQQKLIHIRYCNKIRAESQAFLLHLALFLRISPNFERAVWFATESSDEILRRELKPYLLKAYLGRTRYELALLEFARKWKLEQCSRILTLMRGSIEVDQTERERMLDEIMDDLLDQEREELFAFCSWLYTPLLVLYSMGILLPIALLPALPVLSAFGLSLGTIGFLSFLMISLILTYVTSQYLLAKSPFVSSEKLKLPPTTFFSLLGALPSLILNGELRIWLLLWIPTALFCLFLWNSCRTEAERREESLKIEEELPAILRQVGNGMMKGLPAEEVLKRLEGGELAKLLRQAALNVMFRNVDVYSSLFDSETGVLRKTSCTTKETLSLAFSISKKSTVESGRTLIRLSNHLNSLRKVKREGKRLLKATLSSMYSLSFFFGPAILAITARMLFLLQSRGTDFLALPLDSSLVLLSLGVYCLGLCWVLSSLYYNLEGEDVFLARYQLAQALPLSLLVYTVFSLFGYQLIRSLLG
jgi:hypothetical protein